MKISANKDGDMESVLLEKQRTSPRREIQASSNRIDLHAEDTSRPLIASPTWGCPFRSEEIDLG